MYFLDYAQMFPCKQFGTESWEMSLNVGWKEIP